MKKTEGSNHNIFYSKPWETRFNNLNPTHKTINYFIAFNDPIIRVHINTIEGLQKGIMFQIKPRNRTNKYIKSYALYFCWRRKNKNTK
ncbi:hypothetical protein HZS_2242 [Henneguya salminicola]|nr:hypothetical protein HZS_2242 [Henneguya salminicola]